MSASVRHMRKDREHVLKEEKDESLSLQLSSEVTARTAPLSGKRYLKGEFRPTGWRAWKRPVRLDV